MLDWLEGFPMLELRQGHHETGRGADCLPESLCSHLFVLDE
jgi:hypothetical protein